MGREGSVDGTMVLRELLLSPVFFDGAIECTFVVLKVHMSLDDILLLLLDRLGSQIGVIA